MHTEVLEVETSIHCLLACTPLISKQRPKPKRAALEGEPMITNDAKQRILAAVDSAFDDQLTATAELVSSPSRREHEEPAQDLIETHLKHLGLDIDRWVIDSPLEAHPGFGPSTVDYTGMTDIVGTYTPARDSGKSLIPQRPHRCRAAGTGGQMVALTLGRRGARWMDVWPRCR